MNFENSSMIVGLSGRPEMCGLYKLYGVLKVIFVISFMCLFAFVFAVFISLCQIYATKCVNFHNHFTSWFFVVFGTVQHIVFEIADIYVAESGCKGPA